MTEISQEDAVNEFSRLMKPYLSAIVNPHSLIETVVNFYRDVRIVGASIETDGDMLLLEWGTTKPNLISGFMDFRRLSGNDINFDKREFQWLGLTRQIFVCENEEIEFDDEAIALCSFLFFKEKSGAEQSSNLWIPNPSEVDMKLKEFFQNPFVKSLFDSKSSSINVFVTYVG